MTKVKLIDSDSIRHITAGEKISDLETIVRELIENAVDAAATLVEIRMSKFGIDSIEVEDNGNGIDKTNFELLGLRYHTSKIKDFKNLQENLETYGFRGEALACICNLANVTITTRTKSSPTGTKLTFDKNGKLSKCEPSARSIGTTVIVKNIFHSMPVRRRELETTAKSQYNKVLRVCHEQVLARPSLKLTLCKRINLRKERDFSHGGTSVEDNITAMYGVKVMESLTPIKNIPIKPLSVDIKLETPSNESPMKKQKTDKATNGTDTDTGQKDGKNDSQLFTDMEAEVHAVDETFFRRSCKSKFAREKPHYIIYGYISMIGQGRNASDAQYIFVNKRPCHIPRLTKSINDIYKNYSNGQYPFLCLYINVQSWAADFNVPRKQEVILQDESKLLDLLDDTLNNIFASSAPATQSVCSKAVIPFNKTFLQPVKKEVVKPPTPSISHEKVNKSPTFNYQQRLLTLSHKMQIKVEGPQDLTVALERERNHRRVASDSKDYTYAIHPNFNEVAEQELKFNLSKTSFDEMLVLGQFNKGFIITRHNKHIFIIDQHATDERANYEKFLDSPPLVSQRMVHPKPLYLNSIQESIVTNNIELFRSKGFEFVVNPEKDPGLRVMLISTSISKGQGIDESLGKDDVEELIDVINDSPKTASSYVLRKVKKLAAMKACRSSVMIGDKLSWPQMEGIVSKMSGLKNPWACAHGRPTIRHLMEVDWMK